MTTYDEIVARVLAGAEATPQEALTVLRAPDEDVLDAVAAVARLRRAHYGTTVKVNYLVNLKSGLCPEDCGYCSQALGSTSEILRYTWLKEDQALDQARAGVRGGASRVCMVASGRGPTDRDVERVVGMVGAIKEEHPEVEVCACLGLLRDGQAERLREAGVDAYNHNINTAQSHHDSIVTTHTYEDRVRTVAMAQGAGLSACSGLIAGLGESDEQLVEALVALREMGSDSIPVNFLIPFDGTPKQQTWELTPLRCLRILAAARLLAPAAELRIAEIIEADPSLASTLTVNDLAERASTSTATVVRTAKRLGFEGYPQLRLALAAISGSGTENTIPLGVDIVAADSAGEVMAKLAEFESEQLKGTAQLTDPAALEEVVSRIRSARRGSSPRSAFRSTARRPA